MTSLPINRWDPKPIIEYSPGDVMKLLSWEDLEEMQPRHLPEDKPVSIAKSTRTVQSPPPNGSEKTILSVLVLERLGDHLPTGASIESIRFV
jgi:hypothetical protein